MGVVAVVLALVVAACSGDDGGAPAGGSSTTTTTTAAAGPGGGSGGGGTLRVGVVAPGPWAGSAVPVPSAVAPDDQDGLVLADLLFESLLTLPAVGRDGSLVGDGPQPALAASVEPDRDLVVWTVELAEASFSDGSPVTAADVAATLAAAVRQGPATGIGRSLAVVEGADALAGGVAGELSGVAVVDDGTLEISLVEPYAPFPELLASPLLGIVPAEVAQAGPAGGGGDGALVPAGLVGSGPYEVDEAGDAGTPTVLVRSSDVAGGPDDVEVVAYRSFDDALAGFEAGEVDWVSVPPEAAPVTVADGAGVVSMVPGPAVWWVGVDADQPTLSDVAVRRGLVHAVDGPGIAAELGQGVVELRSVVPDTIPGGRPDACQPGCAYDPAEAERSLVAAGVGDGGLSVAVSGGLGPARFAATVADGVVDGLEAVGVQVAGEGPGVFPWRVVPVVPSPDGYLSVFASTSPANEVGARSEAINGQLAVARATADAAERSQAYQVLEGYVIEQAVVAPVAQEWAAQAVSSRVEGLRSRWDGTFVAGDVHLAER